MVLQEVFFEKSFGNHVQKKIIKNKNRKNVWKLKKLIKWLKKMYDILVKKIVTNSTKKMKAKKYSAIFKNISILFWYLKKKLYLILSFKTRKIRENKEKRLITL